MPRVALDGHSYATGSTGIIVVGGTDGITAVWLLATTVPSRELNTPFAIRTAVSDHDSAMVVEVVKVGLASKPVKARPAITARSAGVQGMLIVYSILLQTIQKIRFVV